MSVYLLVKMIHISCVILSLSGFVIRGTLKIIEPDVLDNKLVKTLPHIVDTVLLTSALTLVAMSGMYPWLVSWVGVKIVGLIVYIVAGTIFMRSNQNGSHQYIWFAVALLAATYIVLVALTKSPSVGF